MSESYDMFSQSEEYKAYNTGYHKGYVDAIDEILNHPKAFQYYDNEYELWYEVISLDEVELLKEQKE